MNTRMKVGIDVWFKPNGKLGRYFDETAKVIESLGGGWWKLQKKDGTTLSLHRAHITIA